MGPIIDGILSDYAQNMRKDPLAFHSCTEPDPVDTCMIVQSIFRVGKSRAAPGVRRDERLHVVLVTVSPFPGITLISL